MRRALFLGRFQPPHLGHLAVIEKTAKRVDEVVVVIGSAQEAYTWENPFTAGERIEMLRAALAERGVPNAILIPVADIHRHNEWVSYVKGLVPAFDEVVTANPLTDLLFRSAGYKVRKEPLLDRKRFSGTQIRQRIFQGEDPADALSPAVRKFLRRLRAASRLRRLQGEDPPEHKARA